MLNFPQMALSYKQGGMLLLLSAVLQIAAFPIAGPLPPWRAALCWIALAPFLFALASLRSGAQKLVPNSSFVAGYLCGAIWYAGNCSWIYRTMYLYGGLPRPVAFIILILFALYLGLYHGLFAYLFAFICRSRLGTAGAFVATPFLWVAVELARGRITGFPWDLLGYSQIDNSTMTRLAPVAGVMGLSFVIATLCALFAFAFALSGRRRWALLGTTAALAAIVQISPGIVRTHSAFPTPATAFLLQENLAVGAEGKDEIPLRPDEEMAAFSALSLSPDVPTGEKQLLRPTHPPPGTRPTVIVWPEAPSHLQSSDPAFRAAMQRLALAADAPLIIGSLGVDFDLGTPRGYFLYDSASLFDRTGTYSGRYDKIHLVPWGEFVPFKQFFSFADKLTQGAGNMDRGYERSVFATGGHSYGVFICYESIFGDEVRQFADNGAEVLVNISDDGWYGDTGAPWQHLNMARMRAIENQRWVLRSTNTGITTAIDPDGHPTAKAPRHVRGAYAFPFAFQPASDKTFYTRHGDWFAWFCVLIALAFLMFAALTDKPTVPVTVAKPESR